MSYYSPTPGPSSYPIRVTVEYPEEQSRLLALLSLPFLIGRYVLLIPQIIVLYILGLVASIAMLFNFLTILFTGHSSKGLHGFIAGVLRWAVRVYGYLLGLTDKYPPFSLSN